MRIQKPDPTAPHVVALGPRTTRDPRVATCILANRQRHELGPHLPSPDPTGLDGTPATAVADFMTSARAR